MSRTGVVLCGGASSRMGSDMANLTAAGKALAIWVAEAMQAAGVHRVVAQGGCPPSPLRAEPDSAPGSGPLGGLVDALRRHREILVCPADVPTVPPQLLIELMDTASATGAPVVLARSDRLEPLIGCYGSGALEMLTAGLRSGARGPASVLGRYGIPTVEAAAADVVNVNTPADLAEIEPVLAQRRHSTGGAGAL